MKRFGLGLLLGFCLMLCGCSAPLKSLRDMVTSPAEQYRQKALAYEKQGCLQEALFSWRVAAQLDPQNTQIPKIIKTLERAILNAAITRYRRGLEHHRAGDFEKARREFLVTLRLMPTYARARVYLKKYLNARKNRIYEVKRGDSYIRIATKLYNDPTKAFMISYYNDLNPKKPLLIGQRLILPNIDPRLILPRSDIGALLERAQKALAQQSYDTTIRLTDRIKTEVPGHEKASHLADTANYHKGMALLERQQYRAALKQLKLVRPSFKGRNKAIRSAIKQLTNLAVQTQLKRAQTFLEQKDYQRAIQLSEELLTRQPDQPQAKVVSMSARYNLGKQLIDQDEDLNAIKILSKLDPAFEDTAQLLSQARGKLHARSEALYRSGVKHFLNEELELAIDDWEKALKINPNHPKAAQDIENAQRLLNKWRGLDKAE